MNANTTDVASSNRRSRKRRLNNGVVRSTAVKRRLSQSAATVVPQPHMSANCGINGTMLPSTVLNKSQDASLLKRNHNVESLIKHDNTLPMAYNNSVKKGMSKTVKEIQKSKCAKFFGVELDVSISEIPKVINPIETIVYVDWKQSGNVFNFDAKQLSTTAWRHFGLSWHDYMNMVILASPLRRDRLILEKVKNLGPPRSINALRQTFALGDSRSRRIFFQIYYVPRIAEQNNIRLPNSIRILEKQTGFQQLIPGVNAIQSIYPIAAFPLGSNYLGMVNGSVIDLTRTHDIVNIIEPTAVLPTLSQGFVYTSGTVMDSRNGSQRSMLIFPQPET